MRSDRSGVYEGLRLWVVVVAIAAVGFAIAFHFAKPAPPHALVLATGSAAGAYQAYGERFRDELARSGITLELRPTAGSVENLALLAAGEVDVAFVQGGTVPQGPAARAGDPGVPGYAGIASLYYDCLLYTSDAADERSSVDLGGRR